jgi:mRNA-degrading endonuclease toxin of MazEF toxin-antitoxin module
MSSLGHYLIAAGLGALVGATELISRYRDRPASLVRVLSTWAYVLINAVAGVAALLLMHIFGWDFGATTPDARSALQVLVASFGSMALFRSALFTVRIHDQDVAVGPSTLLTALLASADRGVDRVVAQNRSARARQIMVHVSFAKSRLALPALCLALLQNVPAEDQRDLRTAVDALAASEMTDTQKALNLGLLLMNVAGSEVLDAAVKTLREEIRADAVPKPVTEPAA